MSTPNKRTISFLTSFAFPGAYFLDDALWRAESGASIYDDLPKVADIQNAARIGRIVRGAILAASQAYADDQENQDADRTYELPITANMDPEFLHYNQVEVQPGYRVFHCPDCDRLHRWEDVAGRNFRCPDPKHADVVLAQLQHVFVHAACGTVHEMQPNRCWNPFNGERCNAALRLHLVYSQMSESYWWCPQCRYERRLPAESDANSGAPGWKLPFRQRCNLCSTDERPQMMTLTPARTVFKPQRVDAVDMPTADPARVLDEWFGGATDIDAIRSALPPNLQRQFDSNPATREQLLAAWRADAANIGALPALNEEATEQLSNLAGAHSAIIRGNDSLSDATRQVLEGRFGLAVHLLDDLGVVRGVYGYLVGDSNPAKATLRVFPMRGPRYAVLTQRIPTEALLFELAPERVLTWLQSHSRASGYSVDDLRRHLVSCLPDDDLLVEVNQLVHTAAHALRRSSERYTGMGRDVVDELLFPRGLAWALYNNRGSELGMFTTTFEGRMREWLMGTEYDLKNCPFDPLCMREDHAACPGCLHVSERGCTTYWNKELNRRHLVSLQTSQFPAYWS